MVDVRESLAYEHVLHPAQKVSLELLQVIDDICRSNKITYALGGTTLIGVSVYNGFLPSESSIAVTMLYPDFLRFIEFFKEKYRNSAQYSLLDSESCDQFEALYIRVLKSSKVSLPEDRRPDEKYYSYFINVFPIFYVGDAISDYKKVYKKFRYYLKLLRAYTPAPDTFRIKNFFKRAKNSYYLRKKTPDDFKKLSDCIPKLIEPTKYVFLPFQGKVKEKGVFFLSETYKNVVPYSFHGISTFIPANCEAWINCYYPKKQIEYYKNKLPNQAVLSGPEIMRRVQLVELEMLVEMDRVCRKHNIKYSLFAGTLLGAVRHKGFIPWDDDVDVVMLYEDYLKFIEVASVEMDTEKYFLRTQESDVDNNLTFIQVKRNGTLFRRHGREIFNTHNGVFIDIMPMFNASGAKLLHKLQIRLAAHYRTATWAHMGAESERQPLMRMYYRYIAKPSNKVNYEKFIKYATIFKKDVGKMICLGNGIRAPFNKAYGLKSSFDNLGELEFEGHSFFAFANYDEVLSYAYSKQYMRLPIIVNRVAKHLPGHVDLGDLYSFEKAKKDAL